MTTTLRQRIRKDKIRCIPWRKYKYEIRRLPISAQTLFSKNGLPIDILERELRGDGWLFDNENLLEVLSISINLKRLHLSEIGIIDLEEDPFDETWTEEDYKNFYNDMENS